MFDDFYDDYDLDLCEAFAVDRSAGEILTEFATVGRFQKQNFSLAVNPDRKRNLKNAEYFKVYNHIDPERATKIARISFRSSSYIIHHQNGGKKNWVLNQKERKELMQILQSSSKKHPGYTVWQSLILYFNYEVGLDEEKTKENRIADLRYPMYLPIDLRIPNYESFLILIK